MRVRTISKITNILLEELDKCLVVAHYKSPKMSCFGANLSGGILNAGQIVPIGVCSKLDDLSLS